MATLIEQNLKWVAGVKNIQFAFEHLLSFPIQHYFTIKVGTERPLVFHPNLRMNTIPRNELIALYDLIYYYDQL